VTDGLIKFSIGKSREKENLAGLTKVNNHLE